MTLSTNGRSKYNNQSDIIVGLDIGTSKICALVARPGEGENKLNILGIGIAESSGISRGAVENLEKTVKSMTNVIDQAEQQAGVKIEEVIIGIAGDHIQSVQNRGIVGISSPTREITQDDVVRVLEESRRLNLASDRKILHVIPQEFIIDGQGGIYDPVGMSGLRMEALVNIITGNNFSIENIFKCVEKSGLTVRDVVLEPIASSIAVLDEEEKEIGVAIVDIGAGTTDIAVFENGILRFTSIFAIAGKKVTDDIQKGLRIVQKEAERVKKENGHTYRQGIMRDEVFMIRGVGGRNPMEVSKSVLCSIIQPRMEEIFEMALSEIKKSGFSNNLGAGVVLTGGTSLLRGAEDLALEVFGMPVKMGSPTGISYSGLAPEVENPIYSTAVGLTLYGLNSPYSKKSDNVSISNGEVTKDRGGSLLGKLKDMINNL